GRPRSARSRRARREHTGVAAPSEPAPEMTKRCPFRNGGATFPPRIVRQHPEARSRMGDPPSIPGHSTPSSQPPQDPISMSRDRHLRRSRSGSPTGRRALGALTLIGVAGLLAACAPASRNSSGHGSTPALDASRVPAPAAPVTTRPTTYVTAGARAGIGGCDLFPVDHAFHASIASLPVRSGSAATIAAIGPSETILPGFSAEAWMGSRSGYPTNLIDSRTAPRSFIAVASMYQSVS